MSTETLIAIGCIIAAAFVISWSFRRVDRAEAALARVEAEIATTTRAIDTGKLRQLLETMIDQRLALRMRERVAGKIDSRSVDEKVADYFETAAARQVKP